MALTQATFTRRQRAPNLTRDQRLQILTLSEFGHTKKEISERLNVTSDQVRATVRSGQASPGRSKGRPFLLTAAQVDELEAYIMSSPLARQMSFLELAVNPFSHWNCGENAIRMALVRRGYRRCLVRTKTLQGDKRAGALRWETRKRGDRERGREMFVNDGKGEHDEDYTREGHERIGSGDERNENNERMLERN